MAAIVCHYCGNEVLSVEPAEESEEINFPDNCSHCSESVKDSLLSYRYRNDFSYFNAD